MAGQRDPREGVGRLKTDLRRVLTWIDDRTGLETAVKHFLYEEIPSSSGWHHVFGSIALFLILVQAFTGVLLAFNFAPTPGDAYFSVQYIMNELTAGAFIRGLHHWGANLLIVVVVIHMIQGAVTGDRRQNDRASRLSARSFCHRLPFSYCCWYRFSTGAESRESLNAKVRLHLRRFFSRVGSVSRSPR